MRETPSKNKEPEIDFYILVSYKKSIDVVVVLDCWEFNPPYQIFLCLLILNTAKM